MTNTLLRAAPRKPRRTHIDSSSAEMLYLGVAGIRLSMFELLEHRLFPAATCRQALNKIELRTSGLGKDRSWVGCVKGGRKSKGSSREPWLPARWVPTPAGAGRRPLNNCRVCASTPSQTPT